MKHIKLPITSLLVLATVLVIVSGAPVFAHKVSDDDASSSPTNSSKNKGSNSIKGPSDPNKPEPGHNMEVEEEHEHGTEAHHQSLPQLKQQALVDLTERKQKHKSQTDDQRQKVCEARKKGLSTKFDRIVSNSQRLQTRIDGILQKATDYKTSNNLSPTDWDSLVATAQSSQSTSSTSITTLQSAKPAVECGNSAVANDVATFKAAAAQTRDNLKAYRDSVKAVLKSLIEAKKATNGGSN